MHVDDSVRDLTTECNVQLVTQPLVLFNVLPVVHCLQLYYI